MAGTMYLDPKIVATLADVESTTDILAAKYSNVDLYSDRVKEARRAEIGGDSTKAKEILFSAKVFFGEVEKVLSQKEIK